jgi:hypothetical protein
MSMLVALLRCRSTKRALARTQVSPTIADVKMLFTLPSCAWSVTEFPAPNEPLVSAKMVPVSVQYLC